MALKTKYKKGDRNSGWCTFEDNKIILYCLNFQQQSNRGEGIIES